MATTPELQYAKLASHEFGRARFPRLDSLKPAKFQALQAGLSSLGTSRYFERRPILEWNPYAQALPVYHSSELSGRTRNALLGAVGLAEAVHELLHILALEPVFTGAPFDLSAQEFVDFSLIVEAYCYWYGELKYTRDADLRYVDAKRVFHRGCSAASPRFHPDWVLKSEGVTNHRHAFELYQRGFRGHESGLLNYSTPLGRTFAAIVYGFYVANKIPTRRYFRRLREIGVLGRWQGDVFLKFERCVLFDVVGISPRQILETPAAILSVLPRLARSMNEPRNAFANRRSLVKIRRRLQTRAYFVLSDLATLEEGRVVDSGGLPISTHRQRELRGKLTSLRDQLFESLRTFLDSTSVATGARLLKAIDARAARSYPRGEEVLVARRHMISSKTERGTWANSVSGPDRAATAMRFMQDFEHERFFEHDFCYQ